MLLIILLMPKVYAKYTFDIYKVACNLNIDRTKANVRIEYSITESTNQNVVATIISNEPIQQIDGWNISEDGKELSREFETNIQQDIEVKDLAGNISIIQLDIQNIDKEAPNVEIVQIENTNTEYPQYANKEQTLAIILKTEDRNKIEKMLEQQDIQVYVGEEKINEIQFENLVENEKYIETKITLKNLTGNGNLILKIKNSATKDMLENYSEEKEINTGVIIDNIVPEGESEQQVLEDGKVLEKIKSNEKIRKMEGWNLVNDNELTKEFKSNVKYDLDITDLAGNINNIQIDVSEATYIKFLYGVYNTGIGWKYNENKNIAVGVTKSNTKSKIESVRISLKGKIEEDFIQTQGYIYDYWRDTEVACQETGLLYHFNYNPGTDTWLTMLSAQLVTVNENKYMQIGGIGMNSSLTADVEGKYLPESSADKDLYGISGIKIKVKNYDELNVVYQTFIDEYGWAEAKRNGSYAMYDYRKPIGAIRMAIVPNSELKRVLASWNKDVGTYNNID